MQKRTRFSLTNKKLLSSESSFFLYRNNLKNREVDKEAFQNSHLERATIVRAQGTSEEENFEKKPTPSKTDSSGCFGIYRNDLKNREVDKEAFQNCHLERATIVRAQGTSEEENFEKKPTPSKTDSSGCFGIYRNNFCSDAIVEELSLFGELPASLFTFQPVA